MFPSRFQIETSFAGLLDQLDKTIDYAAVAAEVEKVVETSSVRLIETARIGSRRRLDGAFSDAATRDRAKEIHSAERPVCQREIRLGAVAKACCEMSRRDGAIVAWHEVLGQRHPKRAVP